MYSRGTCAMFSGRCPYFRRCKLVLGGGVGAEGATIVIYVSVHHWKRLPIMVGVWAFAKRVVFA